MSIEETEEAGAEVIHKGEFDFVRDRAAEKPNAAGITFKCWKKVPAGTHAEPTLGAEGMSDAEYIRRLRTAEVPSFLQLSKLLGNDQKALAAMREETTFVIAHPGLPRESEFATRVRGSLAAAKLEWTQENLEKAVASCQLPVPSEKQEDAGAKS
jgi:hypothetical protein